MTPNTVPSIFLQHWFCNTDHRTFSFLSADVNRENPQSQCRAYALNSIRGKSCHEASARSSVPSAPPCSGGKLTSLPMSSSSNSFASFTSWHRVLDNRRFATAVDVKSFLLRTSPLSPFCVKLHRELHHVDVVTLATTLSTPNVVRRRVLPPRKWLHPTFHWVLLCLSPVFCSAPERAGVRHHRQDTLLGVFCSTLRGSELASSWPAFFWKDTPSPGMPQSAGRCQSRETPSRTYIVVGIVSLPPYLYPAREGGRHGTPWLRSRHKISNSLKRMTPNIVPSTFFDIDYATLITKPSLSFFSLSLTLSRIRFPDARFLCFLFEEQNDHEKREKQRIQTLWEHRTVQCVCFPRSQRFH